ncbi:hypothetical protein QTP88_014769 [Uroleucon formosanum]
MLGHCGATGTKLPGDESDSASRSLSRCNAKRPPVYTDTLPTDSVVVCCENFATTRKLDTKNMAFSLTASGRGELINFTCKRLLDNVNINKALPKSLNKG